MDNEISGLEDSFLARHTTDPALLSQLLSNHESSLTQLTGRSTETPETAVNTTPLPTSTSTISTLTGNSRTNLTEVHNSLPAPDSRPPSQLQSAFGSVAQGNSTAEYLIGEPPSCMGDYIVESLGSTNNSRLALEQGITRATVKMMRRMMEEREERGNADLV